MSGRTVCEIMISLVLMAPDITKIMCFKYNTVVNTYAFLCFLISLLLGKVLPNFGLTIKLLLPPIKISPSWNSFPFAQGFINKK